MSPSSRSSRPRLRGLLERMRVRGPALLLAATLPGCVSDRDGTGGQEAAENDPLLILAASDLQPAFDELVPLHRSRTGQRIEVMLGSTGNLAAQIRQGAPADLFFAADEGILDALVEAGRIDPSTRRAYAVGRLAIVVPPGSPRPRDVAALADPAYEVVVIANPEHAPYGRAARESLRSAGVWDAIADRLVLGENVAHAHQFVRTSNADAGIVALSLVRGHPGGPDPHTLVDARHHLPLRQAAGIVADSPRRKPAAAFLDFVLSHEGQEILARFGFEPPDDVAGDDSGPYPPATSDLRPADPAGVSGR